MGKEDVVDMDPDAAAEAAADIQELTETSPPNFAAWLESMNKHVVRLQRVELLEIGTLFDWPLGSA